jgi:hypothetical protein
LFVLLKCTTDMTISGLSIVLWNETYSLPKNGDDL